MKFTDNAPMPIIAFDFDGTINVDGEGIFPECGKPRHLAKQVIDFMHKLGIKIVIWTSRDVAYNQEEKKMYYHMSHMIDWLDKNEIHYDAINKSIQFAPYHYNGRKVYAHMYVDDRAFGWYESDEVMIDVFKSFMINICGISDEYSIHAMINCIINNKDPELWMIDEVRLWRIK